MPVIVAVTRYLWENLGAGSELATPPGRPPHALGDRDGFWNVPPSARPMSIQAVSWILDYSESEGLDRLVLISIANHFNNDERESRPSIRLIAREAHISTNTVMHAVRRLTELGELEVISPGSYRVCARYGMPKLPEPKPVDKPKKERRESDTQRRDQRLKSVATVSHLGRDRTNNPEPLKKVKPPCSDCGWQARFANFKGEVDERGQTHPQRHSEAIAEFTTTKGKPA